MNCKSCRLYNSVNCWYCLNNSEYEGDKMKIKIKRLTDTAKIPTYGTKYSACCDVYADENVCIAPNSIDKVHTGISLEMPKNLYARLYIRSSVATKMGLALINSVGVIDSDYRGEVLVALCNLSGTHQFIKQGDRIGQLVFEAYEQAEFEEVSELSETERGTGGFGSTGR